MEKKKIKKKAKNNGNISNKKKNIKTKINIILIVDYIFLICLSLSIIFGIQTNTAVFFIPFTITLCITLISMCIILIHAIYSKIKKKFRKVER